MPVALILGASSDMAVAIARKFASKGYDIQLAGRQASKLEPLRSDIHIRYGVQCSLHEFDALAMDSHVSFFSGLDPCPDIVFCVFGYLGDNDKGLQDWHEAAKIIHSNYTGAVSILNAAAPHFQARKKGTIVGISSVAGERGRQSNFLYGSAKAGFTAYLSGLRNRLYQDHVHVLTLQPGFVYTKMTEGMKLPKLLTATPDMVAEAAYQAVVTKKNVIYVKWFWRWIMLIIKCIPEFVFKKMKL